MDREQLRILRTLAWWFHRDCCRPRGSAGYYLRSSRGAIRFSPDGRLPHTPSLVRTAALDERYSGFGDAAEGKKEARSTPSEAQRGPERPAERPEVHTAHRSHSTYHQLTIYSPSYCLPQISGLGFRFFLVPNAFFGFVPNVRDLFVPFVFCCPFGFCLFCPVLVFFVPWLFIPLPPPHFCQRQGPLPELTFFGRWWEWWHQSQTS